MKKQFSLFLAVIFFAVQMGSFAHMAEHGFEHHEHSGKPCQVEAYFHASQSFDSAHAEIIVAANSLMQIFALSYANDSSHAFELASNNLTRAPPATFL